ncbi:glycosyltransferase [Galactobacter valiniphilus]|uniref:glycosyltransferase n=1 Tax=Galactobacter valiniphilus TaxID=2676122 RepID=UPI003736F7DF
MSNLPAYRYVFSTGQIRQNYGGLTIAMMRRAKLFAQQGFNVEITTIDWWLDYDKLRTEWLQTGRLVENVKIRNIHEEFAALDDVRTGDVPEQSDAPLTLDIPAGYRLHEHPADKGQKRYWYAPGEKQYHAFTEYLRPDGSLYMRTRSNPGKSEWDLPARPVGIYDAQGTFAYAFASHQDWWLHWAKMIAAESPQELRVVQDVEHDLFFDFWTNAGAAAVQYVHTAHTTNFEPDGPLLHRWKQVAQRQRKPFSTIAFATRAQARDWVARMGDQIRPVVAPHAFEGPASPTLGVDRDVVIVSRLAPGKGLDDAVRIFIWASHGVPDAHLHIYGEGSERKLLEEIVAEYEAQDRVHFHGFTPDAATKFAGARATLFTSEHEGFGLTLLEALSQGTPAVSYDVRYGPADMITNGTNGFLIADRNQMDAMTALQTLLTDYQLYERMANAAFAKAKHYSEAESLAKWSDIFEAMVPPADSVPVDFVSATHAMDDEACSAPTDHLLPSPQPGA